MYRSIRSISTFIALLLLIVSNPWQVSAASAGEGSGLPIRTGPEIAEMWSQLMKPDTTIINPYLVKPSNIAPYSPGTLKESYIKDGVNALNFYRFISGLPYDIATTKAMNTQAQYGSVLLAAEGNFSHTPSQPADMPKEFYDKGYASTSSANIYGSTGYDDQALIRSIDAYMEDSDKNNLQLLGHRRWILNPQLKEVGIGLAESKDKWTYSALQIFDDSRGEDVDFHYIPYPAQGAFPVEVFKSAYAWSVSLNSKEYSEPSLKEITVNLKRMRDSKTWSLSSNNNKVTVSGAYFNVDNQGFGTGPVIIFRPDSIDEYRAGDRFEVTINGLKSTDGTEQTITYTVDFMSAKQYDPTAMFSDIAKHWASKSIIWAVDNKIVAGYPDGTFKPNSDIKEEEFLTMFISAMNATLRPATDKERWSTRYYDYANEKGYNLQGLLNSASRSTVISRLAVAELITSAAGLQLTGDSAIQYLLDKGYSQGKTEATVKGYAGTDNLSRAEAVQFIKNLIDADYNT